MSKNISEKRQAVLLRDREICVNCKRPKGEAELLDMDHSVPRGRGGSEAMSNLNTLCRECHDAKHGNGIAPTIEMQSTGRMTASEFLRFEHFMKQILPALARTHAVNVVPKFNLDGRQAWHIPLGDIQRLDQSVANSSDDLGYLSLQAADYM